MEEALEWVGLLTGYSPLELLISGIAQYRRHTLEKSMADKAYVVHHSAGRVRLRVPTKRHNHAFFHEVHERLGQLENVQRVDINPATGSVLVRFTGDLGALIGQAAAAGLTELADVEIGLPPITPVGPRLRGRLTQVNDAITRQTNGTVDGGGAVMLGLLVASVIQIARGQVLGPAVPLLWYAAQALGVLPNRSEG